MTTVIVCDKCKEIISTKKMFVVDVFDNILGTYLLQLELCDDCFKKLNLVEYIKHDTN